METGKRASKGGFLQLFDWNAKSRKKLFSNKSELPEGSKQGKENVNCSGLSQLQQMKVHENGLCPSVNESASDYSCDSSMIGDEGYGSRAPGVVARLMGLDSLPTSNVSEPSFTPFPDPNSFRDFPSQKITSKYQSINYVSVREKLEGSSINPIEIRLQKVQNRPIERFQSEILPPKSAKLIPITHHKLLSPIKNPGFIPRKNAAYIMEAAAKIIEQSPQSTTKHKMTPFGSPSVPLRIRDLKQKLEAAQEVSRLPEASRRPRESSSLKCMGEKPKERSRRRSENSELFKASIDSEKGSSRSSKNKGKSVSLAVQAKVNVRRREESTTSVSKSSMNLKDNNNVQSGYFDKSQNNVQSSQKRSSSRDIGLKREPRRTSDVLRQNNQKQNCVSNKDDVNLKPSVSNQRDRKPLSMNGSLRPSKTSNKVTINAVTANKNLKSETKEHSLCKTKNLSRKRQPVGGDIHSDEHVDNILINKNERSIKCNIAIDGCKNWDAGDMKNSMDVVSFTFTSPIKRSVSGSQTSSQFSEKNDSIYVDPYNDQHQLKGSKLSFPGANVIHGDGLSALLEQKLKELTCIVESSNCNLVNTGAASCSTSSLQESMSYVNFVKTMTAEQDNSDGLYNLNFSLVDGLLLKDKQKWPEPEEVEEHASIHSEHENEHVYPYPSIVSSLEPSFSDGSYNSSDGKTSISGSGSQHCLSAEAQEKSNCISTEVSQLVESETELSDSASSIFTGGMDRTRTTTFCCVDFKQLPDWGIEYVRDILYSAELPLDGFSLCQPHEVISPTMFDQLENQKIVSDKMMKESSKLARKVLFDCVSECMEVRCERLSGGSYKSWARWATLFRRKGWLAEELYKEISGWAGMGELMVDELVDKDMSTQYGKWVDFETEAFEEGIEIEKGILTSLVDELVTDIFLL